MARLIKVDFPLFVGAIIAIIGWLSLSFGRLNTIEKRFWVAWAVAFEILFCLVFSFGCLGYVGAVVSSLNAMVPFIIAGVSVDDMIVVEDFYNKAEGRENRMGESMKAAGVAITTTSVTTVAAFLAGWGSPMPGVSSFCGCCGMAFIWDFFLNVTLFPALIVIDQRRIEQNR